LFRSTFSLLPIGKRKRKKKEEGVFATCKKGTLIHFSISIQGIIGSTLSNNEK
jgi:hypothetical protein